MLVEYVSRALLLDLFLLFLLLLFAEIVPEVVVHEQPIVLFLGLLGIIAHWLCFLVRLLLINHYRCIVQVILIVVLDVRGQVLLSRFHIEVSHAATLLILLIGVLVPRIVLIVVLVLAAFSTFLVCESLFRLSTCTAKRFRIIYE